MINDFSFTFAEIQTVLYDKNNWDRYLNRPFQIQPAVISASRFSLKD